MRIGFIGDVHAEDVLLERALDELSGEGAELVLCVGDIVDGAGDVDRCCALLRERGVRSIRGNHERWLLDGLMRDLPEATRLEDLSASTVEFLAALPPTIELDTPRGRLVLCHGIGEDDMRGVKPWDMHYALDALDELTVLEKRGDVKLVVAGHTHERMARPVGSLFIVNAGTLKRSHQPCFGHIDFEASQVAFRVMDLDGTVIDAPVIALPP